MPLNQVSESRRRCAGGAGAPISACASAALSDPIAADESIAPTLAASLFAPLLIKKVIFEFAIKQVGKYNYVGSYLSRQSN